MKKTFTYRKSAVLCTVSFPLVVLASLVVMAATSMIDVPSRLGPTGPGLIIIFGVLLLIFCGAVLKIVDIIKTTIVLDDQGMTYKSVMKNVFIPWQDIVHVRRWVLLDTYEQFPPPPPKDLKITTKADGNIYVFNFLKTNDQEEDGMPHFFEEVRKMTLWGDPDHEWKNSYNTRSIKMRTVIGIFLVVFGCLFPLLDEKLQHQHSPPINLLISLLGVPGTAISFIAIGLYTAFF